MGSPTIINLPAGLQIPGNVIVPAGGKVHFVHSSGVGFSQDIASDLYTTVDAALNACVTARGDTVLVLPGHTESLSGTDVWSSLGTKTNVRVLGLGRPGTRPAFTWTGATDSLKMDAAGFGIENCTLNLEPTTGTVNVAAPIVVSAAGCYIKNCLLNAGTDANNKVTIAVTTTAAADDFLMEDVELISAAAAEATTFVQLVGADRVKFKNVRISGATSAATVGVVRFLTTLSADITFDHCTFRNLKSGGGATDQIVTGMAGVTGEVRDCNFMVLGNHASNLTDAWGTAASVVFYNCRIANAIAEAGAAFGTLSA